MRLSRKTGAVDEPPASDCSACEQRYRGDQSGRAEDNIGVARVAPDRGTSEPNQQRLTRHGERRARRHTAARREGDQRRRSRALRPTKTPGARPNPRAKPSTGE